MHADSPSLTPCHPQSSKPSVAIVGSGVAALAAASLLNNSVDLTLFESSDWVGGHAHTFDVPLAGRTYPVDTGFVVFNRRTYPAFCAMIDRLGVPLRRSTMSFSVRCDRTGLEYNGTSLNSIFAQRSNLLRPRFWRLLRDILRFHRDARDLLSSPAPLAADDLTIRRFIADRGYSPEFASQYLLPMGSAIWSCPRSTFADFPLRFVIEFFDNHGLITVNNRPRWYSIAGGSRTYVNAIIAPFRDRIRLRTPVRRIRRLDNSVQLDFTGRSLRFDHVIVAAHADQALRLVENPTPVERDILSSFPYEPNEAVLHTDASLLPRNPRALAAWNYRLSDVAPSSATVTYNMNLLQGFSAPSTICLSLNDSPSIDPETILGSWTYHHPVYHPGRYAAQRRHGELINHSGISYCGAYWGYGFHEDGFTSGLRAAQGLIASLALQPGRVSCPTSRPVQALSA